MVAFVVGSLLIPLWIGPDALAQGAPRLPLAGASPSTPESEPVVCWSRTSTAAVHVGEPFSLVVTCSVVDTQSTRVVTDETTLDAASIQLPPFDTLGGTRSADLQADGRRFFQYQYNVRLINDMLFGRETTLPAIPIPYRVQTSVDREASSEGIEHTFVLPPQPIRVLSVVPENASDIRDASSATFDDLERISLRAGAMVTGGGVLIGLAGLLAVIGIARASTRAGTKAAPGGPAISDAAILRAVDRELALVAREREAGGWTPALAARALAALRIAANCALAHPVIQRVAAEEVDRSEGELLVPLRFGRRRLFVSGSSTPLTCSNDLLHTLAHRSRRPNREQRLRELQHILTVLTQVQYGRDESMSPAALDESLAAGRRLVRSLRRELQWVTRTFTSLADGTTGLRQRVWSR